MIYEFALEPELVASWADRHAYKFFDGKFGPGSGRAASTFPNERWRHRVLAAFNATFSGTEAEKQSAEKRITALIESFVRDSTKRAARDADVGWCDLVAVEHERRPFHGGVLVRKTTAATSPWLVADDLDETPGSSWSPSRGTTPRTAAALARALEPMLACASRVLFVDPFMGSDSRFVRPLRAFLEALGRRRGPGETATVELHACANANLRTSRVDPSEEELKVKARNVVAAMRRDLPASIPAGKSVSLTVWAEKPGGQGFHNRYVLTDIGGVTFGVGLDESREADHDDLGQMPREQWLRRWQQFQPNSATYRKLEGPHRIPDAARRS
jgi:hypothetical protein